MNLAAGFELRDESPYPANEALVSKRTQGMGGEMEFLATLARIYDAEKNIDPEIFKRAPSYQKLLPIVWACFDELGWGDQKLDDDLEL